MGDYDNAIIYLEKSFVSQSDNISKYIIYLNNNGLINSKKLNFNNAIKLYSESIDIAMDKNYDDLIATCSSNLAAVYIMMCRYDDAVKLLEQALEIEERTNDNFGKSFEYCMFGSIYSIKNLPQQALEYYEKSLELKEKNQIQGFSDILIKIADHYLTFSMSDKYELALEFAYRAHKHALKNPLKTEIITSSITLAKCYHRLNKKDLAAILLNNMKTTINFKPWINSYLMYLLTRIELLDEKELLEEAIEIADKYDLKDKKAKALRFKGDIIESRKIYELIGHKLGMSMM